jgi:hypothetical protein
VTRNLYYGESNDVSSEPDVKLNVLAA